MVFLICITFSGWFRRTLVDSFFIALIFFIFTALLHFFYFQFIKGKTISKLLIISYFLLLLFQLQTTNIGDTYSLTPSEIDQRIARMNYYPSRLARLGYILETKGGIVITDQIMENLIGGVDFTTYFNDYFDFVALPFLFLGIYLFYKEFSESPSKEKNFVNRLFLTSILGLSIIGIKGKFGPFIISPFLVVFISLGILKAVKRLIT